MNSELTTTEVPSLLRRRAARRVVYGFVAIAVVAIYGAAGYMAMGWSPLDAIFQVVITISGVGFNEVRPLTAMVARFHTMAIIGMGMLSVAFTLGSFVQFLTESEILGYFGKHRMIKRIEALSGHTIVAGYGRVGALVCDGLVEREHPFVAIDRSPERSSELEARGFIFVAGDATEEAVLRKAGIERAKVLVSCMPNDAENVFITLTARQMCSGLTLIARAEQPGTPRKLKQAGADHIVMPAAIGAHRIVSLLTNPAAVEFAELVTSRSTVAIEMDEMLIQSASAIAGHSLRDADIKRRTGVIVVAIKRSDGRVVFPPSSDELLSPGDSVVVLGQREHLDQFRKAYLQV
ncbi:MAG: potassium channel family protein [Isosphaeraceae bacterium]